MKLFLVAIFILVTCNQTMADIEYDWKLFKITFEKNYESDEVEFLRKKTFVENADKILKHNQEYNNGNVSFEMVINEFADLTNYEFKNTIQTMALNDRERGAFAQKFYNTNSSDNVTWIEYVNPVFEQDSCKKAYVFSAVTALEAQYFIKHGEQIQLSQQELLTCSKAFGNRGCNGGLQKNIYNYIFYNNIGYAENNPYTGDDRICTREKPRISINEFFEIPNGDEQELKKAVATVGPIPIDMDAHLDTFRFYKQGIYYDSNCRSDYPIHSMVVIGYGTEKGQDYWLVRNSWGQKWGDNGYIKVARNKNNHCSIATRAVYPMVD